MRGKGGRDVAGLVRTIWPMKEVAPVQPCLPHKVGVSWSSWLFLFQPSTLTMYLCTFCAVHTNSHLPCACSRLMQRANVPYRWHAAVL